MPTNGPHSGRRLGDYELHEQLGSGAFNLKT